ncbi:MarR family winged helix-turn-helix transcriptional regulator [Pseudolysinimonas sp.]|uniref:MarR family winged helix-turn-helix transcriptional regulator n=1 Tax=Pseudolysinimonas sp. TaxID=2680009 RepID=UPI003783A6CC
MARRENDDELRIVLQRVARRIRSNRADGDLGDSQLSVLFHVEMRGPLTPTELAALEHITPPSMNRTVNWLEEAGFAVRERATDDARKVRVTLTPAGQALLAETRRLRSAWFSDELAALTADERAALETALPALRKLAGA